MSSDSCDLSSEILWDRPKEYYDTKIEAVFEDELFNCPLLMPVIVAKMSGTKQDITRIFKLTKDVASTSELRHLRRIRDLPDEGKECIVACLKECKENPEQQTRQLAELERRFRSSHLLNDFRIIQVPSYAPRTEQQREACMREKLWPCKYAKSVNLTRCIDGSELDAGDRLMIDVISNELLRYINSSKNNKSSGAVIYRYGKVNAIGLSGFETIRENPCKHAAMLAIDRLAEHQGCGHWRNDNLKSWCLESRECKLLEQVINERLRHVDGRIRQYKPNDDGFLPYLCTENDVIVTEEPCMMCTMGLVQSRIKRVFYLDITNVSAEDKQGVRPVCFQDQAIEKFLVHRVKELNHHFQAWRVRMS